MNYLFALLLGLSSTLWIIIRDFFNDKITSRHDIEKNYKPPLLGNIIHNEKSSNLVVLNNPKSAISEAFRSIRTNIQYLNSEKESKIISITSSISGEGKTFCSMNLATVFALSGSKTILIGADMRKPKIFLDFKLQNTIGLSNFLSNQTNKSEIIQKTDINNLDVILSGPTPPNPAELLDKDIMNLLLKDLQKSINTLLLILLPLDWLPTD